MFLEVELESVIFEKIKKNLAILSLIYLLHGLGLVKGNYQQEKSIAT